VGVWGCGRFWVGWLSEVVEGVDVTCVVGVVEDGRTYIGADAAGVNGYEARASKVPKVFVNGLFVIGYTTSFRMGQILQHQLRVAPQGPEGEMEYLVCTFVEAVRGCLKEYGFSRVENNVEEGGFFLVGYKGRLYGVEGDFQVQAMADEVMAIGCGRGYALGALKALEVVPARERVVRALEVAAYYSGGVMGPFSVVESKE
jgi:ATP-dependent protease HslVU (ClpYQ) peptidase subunit